MDVEPNKRSLTRPLLASQDATRSCGSSVDEASPRVPCSPQEGLRVSQFTSPSTRRDPLTYRAPFLYLRPMVPV